MVAGRPTVVSVLCGEGTGFFHCGMRGVLRGQLPCVSCQERPAGHGEPVSIIRIYLAWSLLYVSKAFHPVLDCVVFLGDANRRRCSGQKCLESFPGIRNQHSVLFSLGTGKKNRWALNCFYSYFFCSCKDAI